MNIKQLKQFLIQANSEGFASNQAQNWKKEEDQSTTINYKKDDWEMHDNFFGGEPYGGRMVVFYKKKPYWIMVYYGSVKKGVEHEAVYEVLQEALQNMPEEMPLRGPKDFAKGDWLYENNWIGTIHDYQGQEVIIKKDKLVYKASYIGGLVDIK